MKILLDKKNREIPRRKFIVLNEYCQVYCGLKGGYPAFSDNIDEEVPNELPDITEDKPKPVDKKSAKKKEDKKPPPKKPEVVKQKSKPTVVEPMPVVSKPAAKKNKKTVVKETLGKYKPILVKSNQVRVCLLGWVDFGISH